MKKFLCIIVGVFVMFASVFSVACSNNNGDTNSGNSGDTNTGNEGNITGNEGNSTVKPDFKIPEGGYDGSKVTITFYHTMSSFVETTLNKYIVKFNELYPNIKVEHTCIGGFNTVREQVEKELGTAKQPNIAFCYPEHVARYNQTDAVVTLDELIDSTLTVTRNDGSTETLGFSEAQKSNFIPVFYEEGRQFGDGVMYTLPFAKATEVLYYNKSFFDRYELKVPTTWDEMEQVCKMIKKIDRNSMPLGINSEENWFINMCAQYGSGYTSATGEHFIFDNATNRAFVEKFAKWYDERLLIVLDGGHIDMLAKMCISSSLSAPHMNSDEFETGVAPIPQVDPDNPKSMVFGPSVCIFKDSNPQEVIASWLFVKYLTTSEGFQTEFAATVNYIPVIKSANAFQPWVNNDNMVKAYFTPPVFIGSAVASEQVAKIVCDYFLGKKTLDQAFSDAIKECKSRTDTK